MIPFLKGFTSYQSLNQAAVKGDDPAHTNMFYVKMMDGVWGE
jgi:hypothetical protein